jgi:homoserine kinase
VAAQLFSGKIDLHPAFFDDRLHQPFRVSLVPGLDKVLHLEHPDLLGVCLSGAGPSILAFAKGNPTAVGEAIRQTLAESGVQSHAQILTADNRGAKGWSVPA